IALFTVEKELRSILRRNEIQLAILVDAFRRSEPERFIANDGTTTSEVVVPAQEVGDVALVGDVGTVESVITMVDGSETVCIIGTGFGDDIDHAAGSMAELCFVTGGDDLEFSDRILVELRGWTAGEFILVREAVDKEASVIGPLAENGRGVIAVWILMA